MKFLKKTDNFIDNESRIKSISGNFTSGMIYQLIIKTDGTRTFTYLSDSVKTLYGIKPEEGIADSSLIYNNIHPEDIEPLIKAEDEAMQTLSIFKKEARMKHSSGIYRWSTFVSKPTLQDDGSVCWDGIEFDITNLKKTEAELKYNQFLFESIIEGTSDAVFIKDYKGRYLVVNTATAKYIGKEISEIIGKDDSELFSKEEGLMLMKSDYQIMISGVTQTVEEHLTINSQPIVFSAIKGSLKDEQGNMMGLFGISRDITNLKHIEEELRLSKQKFVLAFNSSPHAVFISEQETGKIIECNEALMNIYGYSREEVLGKTTLELNLYKNPEDRQKVIETAKEFGHIRNMELIGLHKSGSELTLIVSLEVCQISGKPHFIVTLNDITERKKTENELHISQEKFALAFHSSPDAIFISDQETGEFLESNNSVETIFGYTREEVIGKTGLGLNLYKNPEDRQKVIDLLLKDGSVNKKEVLGRHKLGHDLNVLLTVGLETINNRSYFITTVHDITERKKIEEKLLISQQKFAIAFNSSPDAIFITEQDTGIIIEVNDAVETVFGFSREEIIGKTGRDLNINDDSEDQQKALDAFKENGHIRNMEVIRKHKSGSNLILLMSVESSIIEGKPCYISTLHDITQQKLAAEKLLESEERFKSIISVSNTGAWEYHTDTDFLWCSPEYFSMLGLNQSDYEILGHKNLQETWIDLLHPDDKEHAINHFTEYLNNGSLGIYENQFRMKHANGNWIWIWSRGQTLRDSEGKVTNLTVGTHIDITERKLTEIELQKLNVDKDRFISILGHDLRGPFNSILSVLDLLCLNHDIEKEESEELLQLAYKSAKNTASLLDDVLTWATAQSGKMSFNPEVINFKDNSTEVIELLQPTANSKNISIELHSNDNLMINADKNMIRTILRNLISNALKFTNTGGQITVSAGKIGDISIISVSDNGVGIDPKNISKIFDKGQLFTSTGTANEKGTGFGLKLCQELVEKHKGKIWVESELDKGATFYFTLPDPNVQN
ncbi:MAG: PAS domain S-box protein [Flavobacterium sp.]